VFLFLFSILLYFTVEVRAWTAYTTVAFLIGGFTSILCGYIGMRIAVHTNIRATQECCNNIQDGFIVAYRGGQVLGFVLVGIALLVLVILMVVYKAMFLSGDKTSAYEKSEEMKELFEVIAGYGLGGSTVALFGRVGGGIYTKAADVGSDLAGKVVKGLEEDDPSNPGVIADNVGDNVGDIAGMGSDLFGSLAEATCAGLVVSALSPELMDSSHGAMYFPLTVTAAGIIVSFVTTFFATNIQKVNEKNVESTLKWQLIISTILFSGALVGIAEMFLPDTFSFVNYTVDETTGVVSVLSTVHSSKWNAIYCVGAGLWSGLAIGFITEYYTSNTYAPVQELADSCRMGAAPNIIMGLALGYMSNVIPIFCLCITVYIAFETTGMYGVALAALGMLSNLPIALAIDGYGPIADNAGGIAEMSGCPHWVRKRTDLLDAAGNTTAAIGKGFAIGSAALVSLALFGAFVTRTGQTGEVNILSPLPFSGLLLGAMIPYWFSAMTMKAVGIAAQDMIKEISRQFQDERIANKEIEPDYAACIKISTDASLKYMIAPGVLVLATPFVVGFAFGPTAVSGLLAGILVSGVQIAISFSNTGGAWDNAKKYVEAGVNKYPAGEADEDGNDVFKKGTEAHRNAVVGDTVGDPLKDTSGPSINILVKLAAITSLVFGGFFQKSNLIILIWGKK
jgi:inorganic pyrophosphatase